MGASNQKFQYLFNKNVFCYKIPVKIKLSGISKLQTNASPRHLPTSNPYVFCPLFVFFFLNQGGM